MDWLIERLRTFVGQNHYKEIRKILLSFRGYRTILILLSAFICFS